MSEGVIIFLVMVFATVFFLAQGLTVPVFGEGSKMRKRLKERLSELDSDDEEDEIASLLRNKYLSNLAPWEKSLESLRILEPLRRTIEQAGYSILAYRLVLLCIVLAIITGVVTWNFTRIPLAAALGTVVGGLLPFIKVWKARSDRMEKFEEQLPEAIDSMRRALRAGHPFNAAIKLVADDMDEPIAREFELTFADINYGNDVRRAMLGLLQRVPSMNVMALVTSVLVQKETGGNLAEILGQISSVIRGRFRFHRRIKTLSAEGRLSGWILALIPFVLCAILTVTSPDYLPVLFEDPVGRQVIAGGFVAGMIGILWIRRIIRVEV